MKPIRYIAATLVVAFLFFIFSLPTGKKKSIGGESLSERPLRCVLNLGRFDDSTKALVSGYNYALLKDFASDASSCMEIITALDTTACYADSLKEGAVDLMVVPAGRCPDSLLCSNEIDGLTNWVLGPENLQGLVELNNWINGFLSSPSYIKMHRKFVRTIHDPYKVAELGMTRTELSPYDSLFRVFSDKLGWDWRLLAAVSFKESKFNINAHSGKGAAGLMQIVPSTAERFGATDRLDPEENLKAGTEYLRFLQTIFSKKVRHGADEDLMKFVLAAYNAGEGHIIDCVNYASQKGLFDSTWNSVSRVLPEMSHETFSKIDTVKLGAFDVGQSVTYVHEVLDIYDLFREICP